MVRRCCAWVVIGLLGIVATVAPVHAQWFDDITVGYDRMVITEVNFKEGPTVDVPTLERHYVSAFVGRGPLTLGMIYQQTQPNGALGVEAKGLMVTGAFEHNLAYSWRLRAFGRVGVTPDVDFDNILYPTDTDLQVNIGYFNSDGRGFLLDYPLFPSAYAGLIVNRFGRVQTVAGAGTWWRGVNLYLTGFYALNGFESLQNPGPNDENIFGNLRNSGVSLSLSYDLAGWSIGGRRNFPVFNSGNEFVFSLRRTFFL